MVKVWRELSDEEKEKLIREAKKLRVYGYGYVTIAKIFEERYSIKVDPTTIERKLNPEEEQKVIEKQKQRIKIIRSIIKNNRDYILEGIKKGFEEGKTKEEIANKLSKELNLPLYVMYYLTSGIEKIIKNPEMGAQKLLAVREMWWIVPLGINYIKEKYQLPILYKVYGDCKRVYEALQKGPLITDEIKETVKTQKTVDTIRCHYNVLSLRIPFSSKWIYFLPKDKNKALEIARKKALEYFRSRVLRLKYRFDEECEKAILSILSLPFVREDDKNLKKLKEYKGIFNQLLRRNLKCIKLDGKKYYSFWDYGLEDVKKLNELTKELFYQI